MEPASTDPLIRRSRLSRPRTTARWPAAIPVRYRKRSASIGLAVSDEVEWEARRRSGS